MKDNTLLHVTYGMYLVGSIYKNKMNSLLVSSLMQVNLDPDIVAISIMKSNHSHDMIKNSLKFSASVISRGTPISFIHKFGHYSGKDTDKFNDVNFTIGQCGCPIILDNVSAFLEADIIKTVDLPNNTIFIANVVRSQEINDKTPLSYADYNKIIKAGKYNDLDCII